MVNRIMITGASGLLGRAIYREFNGAPVWETLGLAFSRARGNLEQVNITDRQAVNSVVQEYKPHIIVHSAGERRTVNNENQPENSKKLNHDATQYICEAAAAVNAWVLYMSTDYVFDGTKPPYKATDVPNPINEYGKNKVEGEVVTMQVSQENGILRFPVLYGECETLDESSVTVLFDKVKDNSKTCVISAYERRYPTHCYDVAYVIRQVVENRLEDKTIKGICHWSKDKNMTKYDMAVSMATMFGLPTDHIKADNTRFTGPLRPYDAHLDLDRI